MVLRSVASLWNSWCTKFQGGAAASDVSSWKEDNIDTTSSASSSCLLLLEAQERFAHAQEVLICGGSTMTHTEDYREVTKALENVRDILSNFSDEDESEDDEHDKEN